MLRMFNLILATGLMGLGFAGCKSQSRNTKEELDGAFFGQAARPGDHGTGQIEFPRNSNKYRWIEGRPIFWVIDGLERAEVVVDKQGTEILRLHLTTAGSLHFEEITRKFSKRNLFYLYALPDPIQKGKLKAHCVGTYHVHGVVVSRVLDVIPDATHAELEFIVEDLNSKVRTRKVAGTR